MTNDEAAVPQPGQRMAWIPPGWCDNGPVATMDVLVVEDAPEYSQLVSTTLKEAGHRVWTATMIAEAEQALLRAVELDQDCFECHYNLGNLYLDEGDFRLAKLHYEICTVVEPDFPDTYFNLGLVLVMNEEREHAVHALERYKTLVPDHEGVKADELMASIDQSSQAER